MYYYYSGLLLFSYLLKKFLLKYMICKAISSWVLDIQCSHHQYSQVPSPRLPWQLKAFLEDWDFYLCWYLTAASFILFCYCRGLYHTVLIQSILQDLTPDSALGLNVVDPSTLRPVLSIRCKSFHFNTMVLSEKSLVSNTTYSI